VTWRTITGSLQHRTHAPLPKAFHKEPGRMISRGRQNMSLKVFGILPRSVNILVKTENLICSATARTKSALGIIQLWFNYDRGISFQGIRRILFLGGYGGDTPAVTAFTPVLLRVWGWSPQYFNLSVISQNTRPLGTHESAKEPTIHGFGHFRSDFITTCSGLTSRTLGCSENISLPKIYLVRLMVW